jgi:putative thioredoxin
MASLSMNPKEREAIEAFRRDVLEASVAGLVLVRFTAEWCGPCKQMAPLIEKAIAAIGDPRVRQVVIDIDQNRLIAEQFRIQSVPTVYAFLGGRPVDGFVGARSEREIRAFIEKLLEALGPTDAQADLEAVVAEANALLAGGAAAEAADMFAALAREFPERADIIAGYARALLALGQLEGARAALAAIREGGDHPAVAQARAAIELAERGAAAGDPDGLEARLAANPLDHGARFDLANARAARGDRAGAADALLAIIAADRDWEEGKARETLLKLIESVGLGDPWSVETRRRLRQILFS